MFQRFYDEGQPTRLFTGDVLFVGGVGRPDLLGEAQTREGVPDVVNVAGGMTTAYRGASEATR